MLKLLRKLLGLCEHEWQLIKANPMFENNTAKRPSYMRYIYHCPKCCNMKKKIV